MPDVRPLLDVAYKALHELDVPYSTDGKDPKVLAWLTVKLNLEEAFAYLNGYFGPYEPK
jgi:hypothetical protein